MSYSLWVSIKLTKVKYRYVLQNKLLVLTNITTVAMIRVSLNMLSIWANGPRKKNVLAIAVKEPQVYNNPNPIVLPKKMRMTPWNATWHEEWREVMELKSTVHSRKRRCDFCPWSILCIYTDPYIGYCLVPSNDMIIHIGLQGESLLSYHLRLIYNNM